MNQASAGDLTSRQNWKNCAFAWFVGMALMTIWQLTQRRKDIGSSEFQPPNVRSIGDMPGVAVAFAAMGAGVMVMGGV